MIDVTLVFEDPKAVVSQVETLTEDLQLKDESQAGRVEHWRDACLSNAGGPAGFLLYCVRGFQQAVEDLYAERMKALVERTAPRCPSQ
jgi:hypothetical protein